MDDRMTAIAAIALADHKAQQQLDMMWRQRAPSRHRPLDG